MTAASPSALETPRIGAAELKRRLESGQPATILDVRSAKAWDASRQRIRGDIRVSPDLFAVAPTWPKDRLTVAYCT